MKYQDLLAAHAFADTAVKEVAWKVEHPAHRGERIKLEMRRKKLNRYIRELERAIDDYQRLMLVEWVRQAHGEAETQEFIASLTGAYHGTGSSPSPEA